MSATDARAEARRIFENETELAPDLYGRLIDVLAATVEYRRAEKRHDRVIADNDVFAEDDACKEASDRAVVLDEAIEALDVSVEPDP